MTFEARLKDGLPVLQAFFYLDLVILWFKENFPGLKRIPLSPLWAFIPLAAVTALRLLLWAKSKRFALPPDWKRDAAAVGIIVVLVTLVHIPFLAHSFGLMDSDEAVPALMGKHIAEGRQPPLYFYGAFFQGSLPQHYMAAFFKLFGYSIFLAKFSAYLAFVLFLGAQFLLLKKAFSFEFACVAGLFYVLPWRELIRASLDIGSGFPIVFLFGALIFYLTASIVFEDRRERLAGLGFLLGLAFWTHQISVIFGLAVAPFLIYKFKARLKNYLELGAYFLIGTFPLLLNEFARGFPIVRVFFLGQSGSVDTGKFGRARRLLLALISSGPAGASLVYLFVMAAGFLTVVLLMVRRKIPQSSLIYAAYFISFFVIYLLSHSSRSDIVRYLYVLYIVLPVFLTAPVLWLKSKVRFPAAAAFLALVFAASQAAASRDYYKEIRADDETFSQAVAAMTETGERYWIGDFWTSYLLTSLSGEKFIVASFDVRRYYPYELRYWSEGRNNWAFFRHQRNSVDLAPMFSDALKRAGVEFERRDTEKFTFIYHVGQDIFPRIIYADPPSATPDIRLSRIASSKGRLDLAFVRGGSLTPGLGFMVEIPGYSARFFPMPEEPAFAAELPFPEESRLTVRYGLTYAGLILPRSVRDQEYVLVPADLGQPRESVEFLKGIGPQKDVLGRRMSVCAKEACLEVSAPADGNRRLALDLFSFLDFTDYFWYGDFTQTVSISVNGRLLEERPLAYGENRVLIKLESPFFSGRGDVVGLEFRYAMPVSPLENWKASAFLERVGFE